MRCNLSRLVVTAILLAVICAAQPPPLPCYEPGYQAQRGEYIDDVDAILNIVEADEHGSVAGIPDQAACWKLCADFADLTGCQAATFVANICSFKSRTPNRANSVYNSTVFTLTACGDPGRVGITQVPISPPPPPASDSVLDVGNGLPTEVAIFDEDKGRNTTGIIVGCVIAAVVCCCVLPFLFCVYRKRRARRASQKPIFASGRFAKPPPEDKATLVEGDHSTAFDDPALYKSPPPPPPATDKPVSDVVVAASKSTDADEVDVLVTLGEGDNAVISDVLAAQPQPGAKRSIWGVSKPAVKPASAVVDLSGSAPTQPEAKRSIWGAGKPAAKPASAVVDLSGADRAVLQPTAAAADPDVSGSWLQTAFPSLFPPMVQQFTSGKPALPSAGELGRRECRGSKVEAIALLHLQLDAVYENAAFVQEKFRLLSSKHRRVGGQGIVQLVTLVDNPKKKFALKFMLEHSDFTNARAHNANPELKNVRMPVSEVHSNANWTPAFLTQPLPPMFVVDVVDSLEDWSRNPHMDFTTKSAAILKLVKCVGELHRAAVVHMDLKPANLFHTPTSTHGWSIGDFGAAAHIGTKVGITYSVAYAAPEVVKAVSEGQDTLAADPGVDVWALGVIAFSLLTSTPVVPSRDVVEDMAYGRMPYPWEDTVAPKHARNLQQLDFLKEGILRMLHRDPVWRITLQDLQHLWKDHF